MAEAEHQETEEEKEIEYVAVEDPPEEEPKGESEESEKKISEDGDEIDDEDGDDGGEEETDDRLGGDDTGETQDEKRERRRQERKDRAVARKEAKARRASERREFDFLKKRNEVLERRFSQIESRVDQTQIATIDARIADIQAKIRTADTVISKAVSAANGADAVEAQNIRDNLRDHLNELTQAKAIYSSPEYRDQQAAAADPQGGGETQNLTLQRYALDFAEKLPWWSINNTDEDSLIVTAIDEALAGEGESPETREYWTELEKRVKARLPHRFESKSDDDPTSRSPASKRQKRGPTFQSGGRERPLKANEVYISPERKDAMIEAGIWDDPEQRNRYLKQYADYDREHSNTGA